MKVDCLGIDLGTTFSEVAIVTPGGVIQLIPDLDGEIKTPSIVSVAGPQPVVGKAAKPDLITNPHLVAAQFKRLLDKTTEAGKPLPILTAPDGRGYTAIDFSAILLESLKKGAESYLGRSVDTAVVTVPAYFKEAPRDATVAAARIAGFTRARLLSEPEAAAIQYGLEKGKTLTLAVVDFGGGTLDVTLLRSEGGKCSTLYTDGDAELGGSNIDEFLLNYMVEELAKIGATLSPADLANWFRNLDRAREAKEMLSRRESVTLVAEAEGKNISVNLSREMFNSIAKPVLDRVREVCERLLQKSGFDPHRIDRVLAVGGSSRLTAIPNIIKDVFGKEPSVDTDPDLAVAKGAAIMSAVWFGESDKPLIIGGTRYLPGQVQLRTVASHAICVAAAVRNDPRYPELLNVPLIPAGTPLPYTFEERFSPIDPGQTEVEVKIVQGEPHELAANSTLIRAINVPIQRSSTDQERIIVKGTYTEEARFEVTVIDELLGKPVSDAFIYKAGLSEQEIAEKRDQLRKSENPRKAKGV